MVSSPFWPYLLSVIFVRIVKWNTSYFLTLSPSNVSSVLLILLSSDIITIFQALFTVSYLRAHCEMEYLVEKVAKEEDIDSEEGMDPDGHRHTPFQYVTTSLTIT